MDAKIEKIETDTKGYVKGATCPSHHGGNAGLYEDVRSTYRCAGCGTYYGRDEVREMVARQRAEG